jgi:hypothetical protein
VKPDAAPSPSPAPSPSALRRVEVVLRFVVGGLALAHFVLFAHVLWRRLPYPYDLEWMEGGMLLHARRLLDGQPLYGPPGLEFVPFLYTPLYPAVVAALARLFGLSYTLARLVSTLSTTGALVLGYRAARTAGAGRVAAAAAMAAVVAAFPFVGAWYDLARNDQLFLLLAIAGLYVLWARPSRAGAVLGALLLCASYFAKQTGLAVLAAGLVGITIWRWRLAWVYALTAAAALGGLVALLGWKTHGWFGAWVWQAHARHAFYTRRALLETPLTLLKQAPAVWAAGGVTVVAAVVQRRLGRTHLFWLVVGAAGAGIACIGFGTVWAHYNAYIPGVFFPLVALGTLAGTGTPGRLLVLGALAVQLGTTFYNPARFCPTAAQRRAGNHLLQRIADAPGDVFIPYHPYYPVLVGKAPTLHRMGVLDAPAAGFGRPRGLDEALAEGRFRTAILDQRTNWAEWPTLLGRYHIVERLRRDLDAPSVFAGADTYPAFVLSPRPRGSRTVWQASFASDLAERTRTTRPLVLDSPMLAFDLVGSHDERGCHVDLYVEDRPMRSATGPGPDQVRRVEWDVAAFSGRPARLEIVDDSPDCFLRLDEVWAVGPVTGGEREP